MDKKYMNGLAAFLRRLTDDALVGAMKKETIASHLRSLSDAKLVEISFGMSLHSDEPDEPVEEPEEESEEVSFANTRNSKPKGRPGRKPSRSLSEDADKVLQYVTEYGGPVSAGNLISDLELPRPQVSKILGTLFKEGKILREGEGRGTKYTASNGSAE